MHRFGTDHHRTEYVLDGEQAFGRPFLEVFGFTEGSGAVRDRRGAYHIDSEGKPLYKDVFVRAYPFRNGVAAVEDNLGMTHIDASGRSLYTRRFAWVSDFHDGLCAVRYRNGRYTFIDEKGEPWNTDFRYCYDFSEGLAAVLTDDGFVHIDTSGNPLYPERYTLAGSFFGGHAPVCSDGKWVLIDIHGKPVTDPFDRIYEGRNGLFIAKDGHDVGYLDSDMVFRRLYTEEPRDPNELPAWTDDILAEDWDSCVVFMRHSERRSHYLCDDRGIAGTGLTSHGEDLAREIGKKISKLKEKKVLAQCSRSRRCVTTANCIMGGMGVSAQVTTLEEVGPLGTAYMEHSDFSPEDLIRPSALALMDQLKGNTLRGWYTNEVIRDHIFSLVDGMLKEDGTLTLCVNHDLFVTPLIAYNTGRFAQNEWVEYTDGCLFVRKGNETSMVWKGKKYPMKRGCPVPVDNCLLPSDAEMCLTPSGEVRGWQWVPKEDIAWQSGHYNGLQTVCDRKGRFILVRDDGYMVTNRTFSWAGDFSEQSVPVYINGRGASFITDFGDLLNNRWFDEVSSYHEGLAAVRSGNECFYIDVDGKSVSSQRYDFAGDFRNGQAFVVMNGKPCTVALDGKPADI